MKNQTRHGANASMTERDSEATPAWPGADRRERTDRRATGGGGSRRGRTREGKGARLARIIGRDAAMVIVTLAAIIVGVRVTNPIFANSPKVVASLVERA